MPYFDLPLEELRTYAPDLGEPDDLDAFWRETLADARTHDLAPDVRAVDNGLALIETFDVSFSGFGGDRIRGWLHRPVAATAADAGRRRVPRLRRRPRPARTRRRSTRRPASPISSWTPAARGRAGRSATRRIPGGSGAPSHPGFHDPRHPRPGRPLLPARLRRRRPGGRGGAGAPGRGPGRVAVTGASQGGGITLAVASLVAGPRGGRARRPVPQSFRARDRSRRDEPVHGAGSLPRGPSRSHRGRAPHPVLHRRRAAGPAGERAGALLGRAHGRHLPAVDGVRGVQRVRRQPKEIREYPFNRHEGGQAFHDVAKLRWLAERLGKEVHA